MELKYDYTNVMAAVLGEDHGLSENAIAEALRGHSGLPEELEKLRASGRADYMNLPRDTGLADGICRLAEKKRREFENFVVVGIGGSSLGNRAVFEALSHPYHNLLPVEERDGPRMFFPDNVDPELLSSLLETLNPAGTLVNVITKSGSTAETMSNFAVFLGWFKKNLGSDCSEHVIATTDSNKGALRKVAEEEGFLTFPVPGGVGGRFSVLSAVGLVSSAFAGIDIHKLLSGADAMDRRIRNSRPQENPALVAATVHTMLHRQKGKHITVLMPYAQSLRATADWFRQLWAESLGKKTAVSGEIVNAGQTPVAALGSTDQHSQIQLYVEGPNDKMITFIEVENFRTQLPIPDLFPHEKALSYLGGRTLNELMSAELAGTRIALSNAQRPNTTIRLPAVNEETMGQLLFMLEVQTSYAGMMYGVNPYDQPGVEAGKVAAYALMGREEYREKLAEIEKVARSPRLEA
jgi:glucose-6-phosphate isomerase